MVEKVIRYRCTTCDELYPNRGEANACEDRQNQEHVLKVGDILQSSSGVIHTVKKVFWRPSKERADLHIARYVIKATHLATESGEIEIFINGRTEEVSHDWIKMVKVMQITDLPSRDVIIAP